MLTTISNVIFCLFTAWLTAVTLEYAGLTNAHKTLTECTAISHMSLLRVIVLTIAIWILLFFISKIVRDRKYIRWLPVFPCITYITAALFTSFSWRFLAVCLLILSLLIGYAVFGWDHKIKKQIGCQEQKEPHLWKLFLGIFAFIFFCFLSAWTVARVRTFSTPTYDFGIFSQMFHSMKESGLPITTLERETRLSHFAVHVSPIYYLMLPFYMIFPYPETLQVLQILVITSALFPLWKIAKHYGLPLSLRFLMGILLLCYPSYAGGVSYDLHENCFLTPLLLWLFYGMERKKLSIIAVSVIFTWMIKEDAAVYVGIFALYWLLRSLLHHEKKEMLVAWILLIGSIVYFFTVTWILSSYGDGVMSGRYENLMPKDSKSLISVVKTILICPIKAIYECVDSEKLSFIALTMLPFLGLPLLTRKYERLLLLIPYLLFNLMSDYVYQHDIWFQYTFGSTAFLFYLLIINLSDFKISWKHHIVIGCCIALSFGIFSTTIIPRASQVIYASIHKHEYYEQQRNYLDLIPEDASVATTAFYTTYLSQRSVLYDIRYHTAEQILECEYVVLKVDEAGTFSKYNTDGENGKEIFTDFLSKHGYRPEYIEEGILEIYHREK